MSLVHNQHAELSSTSAPTIIITEPKCCYNRCVLWTKEKVNQNRTALLILGICLLAISGVALTFMLLTNSYLTLATTVYGVTLGLGSLALLFRWGFSHHGTPFGKECVTPVGGDSAPAATAEALEEPETLISTLEPPVEDALSNCGEASDDDVTPPQAPPTTPTEQNKTAASSVQFIDDELEQIPEEGEGHQHVETASPKPTHKYPEFKPTWAPESLTEQEAQKRMQDSIRKAMEQQQVTFPQTLPSAQLEQLFDPKKKPIHLSVVVKAARGNPTGKQAMMEDHVFHRATDIGTLAAVFDGFGGIKAAVKAAEFFNQHFPEQFQKQPHIFAAFQHLIAEMHKKVVDTFMPTKVIGCAANLFFLPKKSTTCTIATVGDCRALLVRKIEGKHVAVALSLLKSWSDPEEEQRAREKGKEVAKASGELKPRVAGELSVSRAIGGGKYAREGIVIPQPEISQIDLMPGDTVLMGSDGVFDVAPLDQLIKIVETIDPTDVAGEIVNRATKSQAEGGWGSTDNASVIAIAVKDKVRSFKTLSPLSTTPKATSPISPNAPAGLSITVSTSQPASPLFSPSPVSSAAAQQSTQGKPPLTKVISFGTPRAQPLPLSPSTPGKKLSGPLQFVTIPVAPKTEGKKESEKAEKQGVSAPTDAKDPTGT